MASFAQQRLWFVDQLEPGRASYNIPAAVRLEGQLDISVLERALNEVVRRHEVLRTTFVSDRGVPRQVIAEQLELPLIAIDLGGISDDERELQAIRHVRDWAERPFDLARGPLIRAALLRLSPQEHIVVLTMHHAISDGWSIGVLVHELSALYTSLLRGEPSPLTELAIQYADYAAWQRDWLQDEHLNGQLEYWKRQLAAVPHLELPTDRPRPPLASQRGGQQSATVPKATLEALRALGRNEGATLYITLLAAFQVLLHRYSGQDDIAVGSPLAGRTRPELEGLIGFFVNTLVFRGDLSGDPSFRELLRRSRRTALAAYCHQDVPFEKLVTVLHPDRDASRTPLFQVMFALQNVPDAPLQAPDLLVTPLELASRTSKFDLTLFATEVAEGLRLVIEYSADLFDAATADRMLAHFEILLDEIVADADQSIAAIPMLTPEERTLVISGWNSAPLDELEAEFDEPDAEDMQSNMCDVFHMEFVNNE
jgi:hypothetical protein